MDKAYNHQASEDQLYAAWEQSGKMRADASSSKKPFTIPLPPPNVTGQLHLGHAAMLAIEDILIRFKKMTGHEALWVPGTDHAAIATESVVLRHLGLNSREEMSREDFLAECRKFAQEKHDTIVNQMKKMGAWLDWSREGYTFDEARNHAVITMFKQLYEDGLIERGHRLINWSVGAQSVLSDDELEWEEREETFYEIKCGPFVIGTVRPETKCADSPVVVHPTANYVKLENQAGEEMILSEHAYKERKKALKDYKIIETVPGKALTDLSFEYDTYAAKRKFWVITDEHIDPTFGTGAMTISTAHDAADYEIGQRHGLDFPIKIGFDGKMTALAGPCAGMTVAEARQKSAEIMREKGLLVSEKPHTHRVPLCYRTGTVVEPMISPQWFIVVDKVFTDRWTGEETTLKTLTQNAVREGHVRILPERFEKIYFHWIDNLRDWCISRQIWWGHRIPVWYDEDGHVHLPEEKKFILARHGQSEANAQKILQGESIDTPLTAQGRTQAEKLAEKMKDQGIEKILCSDLLRAKETAEIVSKKLGVPVEVWEELREIDCGDLTGQSSRAEVKLWQRMFEQNTGDSPTSLYAKGRIVLDKLRTLHAKQNTLIISHNGFIAALMAVRSGIQPSQEQLLDYIQNWDMANTETKELTIFQKPAEENLSQDEDTLDTWFSSALWPFSTLGWPDEKAADFEKFYPTDVLETGWDILFFWVARMIMFGRYATGKYPFHTTYLHGMVTDEHGKKMSKSKGNGIDPLDVIAEVGADAVRLSLVIGSSPGNNIPLGHAKIRGYRNFVNKLWNAGRFIQFQIEQSAPFDKGGSPATGGAGDSGSEDAKPNSLADRWILSRLSTVADEVSKNLEAYNISAAGDTIYHFVWGEFCDWYIEASKVQPNPAFAHHIFGEILKLTHPLCPFITEELWKLLFVETYSNASLLVEQNFPTHAQRDEIAESQFASIQELVGEIRRLRAEKKVNPKQTINLHTTVALTEEVKALVEKLAGVTFAEVDPSQSSSILVNGSEYLLQIPVDEAQAKAERAKLEKEISALEGRLANKGYVAKAPAHLIEDTKQKLAEAKAKLKNIRNS